jgi:ribosome biogenesis GTPase
MGHVPALETFGWDDGWEASFAEHRSRALVPGRVAVPHRGAYDVWTGDGELRARLPGRARRDAGTTADLPVVGDWVALELEGSGAVVRAVLPRRSKFSRRTSPDPALEAGREQVVAANVDVVFVTLALSEPVDLRLLDRYLTLAWDSGARPVVVLTKADLVDGTRTVADEVATIGADVPVHVVSTKTGVGLEDVRAHLRPGVTGALVGPSGVGKSSLVNALLGDDLLQTGEVREDGSGRHTTTRRELVLLPGGGLIVDNPGMREIHLWLADEGLEEAFADVVELFAHCRFTDCGHEAEPGCAVQEAIAAGDLPPERWESYRELQRELAVLEERLERRARSRARGRRNPG